MKNTTSISVIIPVYNAKEYVSNCIDSVLSQSFDNVRILLVDDGSCDQSAELLDSYASIDDRIVVMHKRNQGAAAARNNGLDLASHDSMWISFIDADDEIRPNMLEVLYDLAVSSRSDIVVCDYTSNEREFNSLEFDSDSAIILSCKEAIAKYLDDGIINQLVWNKLFSIEILSEVRFQKGRVIDDEFFTYRAILNTDRIAYIPKKLYYYRQSENSIMRSGFSKIKFLDAVDAITERNECIGKRFPEYIDEMNLSFIGSCLYNGQKAKEHLNVKESRSVIGYMQQYIKRIPFSTFKRLKNLTARIWYGMAKVNLSITCSLRNRLRIGL